MTDQLEADVFAIDDVEATGQNTMGSLRRLVRLEGVSRTPGLVVALVLMFLAGSVRFVHVGSAYDVWQDEVNYVDLSISFRHGQFPPRFDGGPFLLHPPLFFALSALWEDLVRTSGSYFDVVDSCARDIVFAIASTGLLYALGTCLGNRYTGAAAGLLFACDPYIMRQNGRALLETSTLMWVLAGYLVLLRVPTSTALVFQRFTAVAGGLVLGLSLVSKDLAIVLLIMPLGVAAWRRWEVSRSLSLLCFSCSLVPTPATS